MQRLNPRQFKVISEALKFLDVQIDRANDGYEWREWNGIFVELLDSFPDDKDELWNIFYEDKNRRIIEGKYFKEENKSVKSVTVTDENNEWF